MSQLIFSIVGNPMRRWKFYTRNGKKFLRDYKRDVEGGMSIMDLQRLKNKQLTEMMNNLIPNVYTQEEPHD